MIAKYSTCQRQKKKKSLCIQSEHRLWVSVSKFIDAFSVNLFSCETWATTKEEMVTQVRWPWLLQVLLSFTLSHCCLMSFLDNRDHKWKDFFVYFIVCVVSLHPLSIALCLSLSCLCLSLPPSCPTVSLISLMGLYEIFWPGFYREHIIRNHWTMTLTWGLFSYLFWERGRGGGGSL